ncbi:4-diphosphocytidyl-2c-methyl-D-erythritol kinase [Plasmodium ovale wallikeri]|uniref:4-(cytidine 5'-diphospho)-2-C-methyl-D-erythritol kinase n=1 Tax=Plasmodium ovale wallikeri TaxID=864142 RepID=A0A1A8YYK1_PLAOA|nr:4-diphosphocytidyl-2c-methyl-D-erythritol kinase [Plasmodium ovale wallikeri]SBT57275.1 4-diphosphocytidyl-2c-methyl-D-erythritol kinase [Plasmodium ovale wallikeri]
MKICLQIKSFLLFCISLVLTNVVSKIVPIECSNFARKIYKPSKVVQLNFFSHPLYNKINSEKYVSEKLWKSSNLTKRNNCNLSKNQKYSYLDKGINNGRNLHKKGNILCNKKMKLIIQLLNRAKWYDFKFFSPAKINLFLRLKEKKETYNEISTLMHSINLGDDIFITVLSKEDQKRLKHVLNPCISGDFLTIKKNKDYDREHDDKKSCQTYEKKDTQYYNNYPLNEDNIIIKVLKRYREELGINDDIRFLVHVNKRIPVFSGVGGGSSNGASVFYFLEKYFYKYLKSNELKHEFLKKIGSDISFFTSSGFAYCTDKGNYVIDLGNAQATISEKRIYLFQVNEGLSSKSVYENVNYDKIVQYNPVTLLTNFITNSDSNKIVKIVEEKEKNFLNRFVHVDKMDMQNIFLNDLEHSAFLLMRKLKDLKDLLISQNIFNVVTMSGSGSSLFAITKSDMNVNSEKGNVKDLIKHVQEKLNVKIKVYLCDVLRKREHFWYKPTKIAEVIT